MKSTSPLDLASTHMERSPTVVYTTHSFGAALEPRYIFGAGALDQ